MADGKVTISTQLDNSGLKKGIGQISGSLGGLKSVIGKITGMIAAAFAVQKVVQFGAACVELGSNVAEVQNVVDTAFGSMAYKMEAFAASAVTNFGMSELAAKKTGSTYMAMAKGLGIAEERASDMAIALTGLTGDVASFYNITQEEADTKLKSIFTGETETLKELGVVMTQANLQAYAMAHGMNSNIQAMTQAEQVELRLAFVTDALSLAAGDFVKTQDSWANQTRILSMQWQQFMAIIGQALTTVLLPVVQVLNSIVSALIRMATTVNTVIGAIFGRTQTQAQAAAGANTAIGSSAQAAADGEQALADSTKAAGKAAKGALASFDDLNVLQQSSGSGSGTTPSVGAGGGGAGISGGMEAVEPPISAGIQKIVDKVQELLAPLRKISLDNLIHALESLRVAAEPLVKKLFEGLEWAWYNLFIPLAAWTVEEAVPAFLEALSAALMVLNAAIEALQPVASWLWENFLKPIASWSGGLVVDFLNHMAESFRNLAEWITENQTAFAIAVGFFAVVSSWGTICAVASTAVTVLGTAISFLLSPIGVVSAALVALVALFVLKGEEVKSGLQLIIDFLQNVFATNWANIFGPVLGNILNGACVSVRSFLENVQLILTGLIDFVQGVFTGSWQQAWQGVQDIFSGIFGALVDIAKAPLNGIIGLINGVINAINGMISGLNDISFDVPDWVPVLGGENFGLNIPSIPQVPYLAQGAVLPPNKPFLAMVGDQTSGTNVEAPLDTIKQALAEVMATGGNQDITIKFAASGGLSELVRVLKPYIDREETRVGARLISGGVY